MIAVDEDLRQDLGAGQAAQLLLAMAVIAGNVEIDKGDPLTGKQPLGALAIAATGA